VSLTSREPLPTTGDPVRRRWPRLLRSISWALAPRKRGVASAFQAEVAAPGHLIFPLFQPASAGIRLVIRPSACPQTSAKAHTRERWGDAARHPGPQGRGYQQPRPMNRPDLPHRVPVSVPTPPLLARTGRVTRRPPVKRALSPARPFIGARPRKAVKRWQLY
jgi:hypothetical protein